MKLLTPEQVAEDLQLDVVTIRRLCQRGELPARKIAGKWRIEREYLAWLANEQPLSRSGVRVVAPRGESFRRLRAISGAGE